MAGMYGEARQSAWARHRAALRAAGGAWEPTFPNARYFFGREEYEHWQAAAKSGDGNMNSTILDDSIAPIVDDQLGT